METLSLPWINRLIGKGMWPTPGPTICQGCLDTRRFEIAENTPQGQGHGKALALVTTDFLTVN